MVESLFAMLETEFSYRRICPTKKRAMLEVGASVEERYNSRRRHTLLGQLTRVSLELEILRPDRGTSTGRITPCRRTGGTPGQDHFQLAIQPRYQIRIGGVLLALIFRG